MFAGARRTLSVLQAVDLCETSQSRVASYSVHESTARLAPHLGHYATSLHLCNFGVEKLAEAPRQEGFVSGVRTIRRGHCARVRFILFPLRRLRLASAKGVGMAVATRCDCAGVGLCTVPGHGPACSRE